MSESAPLPPQEPSESAKRLLREGVIYRTTVLEPTPHEIPHFTRSIDKYGLHDDHDALQDAPIGANRGNAQQVTPHGERISTGSKAGPLRNDY